MQARIAHARVLHADMPLTPQGLRNGSLTPFKSMIMLGGLAELDPAQRRFIEAEVLPDHAEDNPTLLKTAISRAIKRRFPQRAKKKAREKHLQRAVVYRDLADDQAMLYAIGPAAPLRFVFNQLDAAARGDVVALPPRMDTTDVPPLARSEVDAARAEEENTHRVSIARRRYDLFLDCLVDSVPAPDPGVCPGDPVATIDSVATTDAVGGLREGVLRRLPVAGGTADRHHRGVPTRGPRRSRHTYRGTGRSMRPRSANWLQRNPRPTRRCAA